MVFSFKIYSLTQNYHILTKSKTEQVKLEFLEWSNWLKEQEAE